MDEREAPRSRNNLGTELGMLRYRVTGLTQEKLAGLVGVSSVTTRNWENGTYKPSFSHLQKLVEAYLQAGAFSVGREQAEAKALWAKADLHAAFDERWFGAIEKRYLG